MIHARRRAFAGLSLAALILAAGCVTEQEKRDAIGDVNAAFQKEYEATLAKNGTHVVPASRDETYDAVYAALVKLGLVIHEQSRDLGVISAEAPAPSPLTRSEFDRCAAIDLPNTRDIIRRHLGAFADRFNFDTKGLDTVMTATIIGVRGRIRDIVHDADARGFPCEVGPPATRLSAADRGAHRTRQDLGRGGSRDCGASEAELTRGATAASPERLPPSGRRRAPGFRATASISVAQKRSFATARRRPPLPRSRRSAAGRA